MDTGLQHAGLRTEAQLSMTTNHNWQELFIIKQFFERRVCAEILAELKAARSEAATLYGRGSSESVDQRMRRSLHLLPSNKTVELVSRNLLECKSDVEQYFEIRLDECEDPQFLHYRTGDFFVAHQDGNTGMVKLDSEKRRISVVIFLSDESDTPQPNTHCGGSLVFSDYRSAHDPFRMVGEPGMLVAFRSETTHEVTPVTHGERYSIVSWFR